MSSIGKIFPMLDILCVLIYTLYRGEIMIERSNYLDELKRWKDKDLIKVVTGIRRCGKSTLFEQFINYLKSIGINDEEIYLDIEINE